MSEKQKNTRNLNDSRCFTWQREKDSNPHIRSQSPLCYLYTIPLNARAIIPTRGGVVKDFFQKIKNFSFPRLHCLKTSAAIRADSWASLA